MRPPRWGAVTWPWALVLLVAKRPEASKTASSVRVMLPKRSRVVTALVMRSAGVAASRSSLVLSIWKTLGFASAQGKWKT